MSFMAIQDTVMVLAKTMIDEEIKELILANMLEENATKLEEFMKSKAGYYIHNDLEYMLKDDVLMSKDMIALYKREVAEEKDPSPKLRRQRRHIIDVLQKIRTQIEDRRRFMVPIPIQEMPDDKKQFIKNTISLLQAMVENQTNSQLQPSS